MFDPYEEWLGIPKARRPITFYQLLDIDPDERDAQVIAEAAESRSVIVSANRDGPHAQACERILNEIEKALATLLNATTRKEYDARLRKLAGRKEPAKAVAEAVEEAPPAAPVKKKVAPTAVTRSPDRAPAAKAAPARPAKPLRRGSPKKSAGIPWLWIGIGGGVALLFVVAAGVVAIVLLTGSKKTDSPRQSEPVAQAPKPEPAVPATQAKPPEPKAEPPKPPEAKPPEPQPSPPPPPPKPPEAKPAAPKIVKLPVPDETALANAEKALKEEYKAEYAGKTPDDRLALSAKFLQPGRENRKDPAAWFVMLREARDLAVQVERPRLAVEAINELNKWFLIDGPDMKVKTLTTLGQSPKPNVVRSVMWTALAQVSQALDEDSGEAALRLTEIAESAAAKVKADEDLRRTIAGRKDDVEAFRKDYPAIAAAREKLKQAPDDPAANLLLGKHLCFFHGRWDEGLPLLVKGNDAGLKALAQKDLAAGEDPKVQTDVGDAWWLISRQQTGRREIHVQERALHWYARCEPKLAGADKTRVADRVKEVQDHETARIPRLLPGSFYGRDTEDRILLLREGGGTMRSEEAIELGLQWLAKHQYPSGLWSMDGLHFAGKCNCTEPGEAHNVAGTAFGLLPFLGVNETHKHGRYQATVRKGLAWLVGKQNKEKGFFHENMYEHALATIAICEAYGLTRDPGLAVPAQAALNYIIRAQNDTGSWGYSSGAKPGDTSVTGWQFSALKAGVYARLAVPTDCFNRAGVYLDTVADPSGLGYGYNTRGTGRATSAVGLLIREYLNVRPRNPDLDKGVTQLLRPENFVSKERPAIYFLFYATQVMHHFGGKPWEEWNPKVRDLLVEIQDQGTDPQHPHQKGSWSPRGDDFAKQGGRLMFTSLALLTLEQYYYSVPINGYGSAVLQE
jgi:hypothetical protein